MVLLGEEATPQVETTQPTVDAVETVSAPPVGTPVVADSVKPSGFWESVPDDIKSNPSVAPFHGKEAKDVLEAYIKTKSMVGADTVKKPSKHATWEDRVNFLKEVNGIPKELKEYEIKLPENSQIPEELLSKFKETAHANGVLPGQFEALLNQYSDYFSGQFTEIQTTIDNKNAEDLKVLKSEYGAAYDDNMRIARLALKELAGDRIAAVDQEMVERGWGSSPEVARLLVAAGKVMFTESEIKGKSKAAMAMSPGDALQSIRDIQGNRDHPFNVKGHPNQKHAIEEMRKLHQFAYVNEEAS